MLASPVTSVALNCVSPAVQLGHSARNERGFILHGNSLFSTAHAPLLPFTSSPHTYTDTHKPTAWNYTHVLAFPFILELTEHGKEQISVISQLRFNFTIDRVQCQGLLLTCALGEAPDRISLNRYSQPQAGQSTTS